MSSTHDLDRPAFAETFLASHAIDAVHILPGANNWYQDPDLPALLEQVRTVTAGYAKVIAYGSSMGGYAALRFGAMAGADEVIAISPQYSVLPERASFDRRWDRLRQKTVWLHETLDDRLPTFKRAVLIYDNRDRDGLHMALIAAEMPGATMVAMPYVGHPAISFMAEAGFLSSAILDIARGTVDPAILRRKARAGRRRSGHYLRSLARHQPVHRMRTKLSLSAMAVAAQPSDSVYLSYYALMLEVNGRHGDALDVHRQAASRDDFDVAQIRYGRSLWRAGDRNGAHEWMARASRMGPGNVIPVDIRAHLLALDGQPAVALRLLIDFHRASRPWVGRLDGVAAWLDRASPTTVRWIGRALHHCFSGMTALLLDCRAELKEADRDIRPVETRRMATLARLRIVAALPFGKSAKALQPMTNPLCSARPGSTHHGSGSAHRSGRS